MKILVSTASKRCATAQIGEAIASRLSFAGHGVVRRDPGAVRDLDGVDAVVAAVILAGSGRTK